MMQPDPLHGGLPPPPSMPPPTRPAPGLTAETIGRSTGDEQEQSSSAGFANIDEQAAENEEIDLEDPAHAEQEPLVEQSKDETARQEQKEGGYNGLLTVCATLAAFAALISLVGLTGIFGAAVDTMAPGRIVQDRQRAQTPLDVPTVQPPDGASAKDPFYKAWLDMCKDLDVPLLCKREPAARRLAEAGSNDSVPALKPEEIYSLHASGLCQPMAGLFPLLMVEDPAAGQVQEFTGCLVAKWLDGGAVGGASFVRAAFGRDKTALETTDVPFGRDFVVSDSLAPGVAFGHNSAASPAKRGGEIAMTHVVIATTKVLYRYAAASADIRGLDQGRRIEVVSWSPDKFDASSIYSSLRVEPQAINVCAKPLTRELYAKPVGCVSVRVFYNYIWHLLSFESAAAVSAGMREILRLAPVRAGYATLRVTCTVGWFLPSSASPRLRTLVYAAQLTMVLTKLWAIMSDMDGQWTIVAGVAIYAIISTVCFYKKAPTYVELTFIAVAWGYSFAGQFHNSVFSAFFGLCVDVVAISAMAANPAAQNCMFFAWMLEPMSFLFDYTNMVLPTSMELWQALMVAVPTEPLTLVFGFVAYFAGWDILGSAFILTTARVVRVIFILSALVCGLIPPGSRNKTIKDNGFLKVLRHYCATSDSVTMYPLVWKLTIIVNFMASEAASLSIVKAFFREQSGEGHLGPDTIGEFDLAGKKPAGLRSLAHKALLCDIEAVKTWMLNHAYPGNDISCYVLSLSKAGELLVTKHGSTTYRRSHCLVWSLDSAPRILTVRHFARQSGGSKPIPAGTVYYCRVIMAHAHMDFKIRSVDAIPTSDDLTLISPLLTDVIEPDQTYRAAVDTVIPAVEPVSVRMQRSKKPGLEGYYLFNAVAHGKPITADGFSGFPIYASDGVLLGIFRGVGPTGDGCVIAIKPVKTEWQSAALTDKEVAFRAFEARFMSKGTEQAGEIWYALGAAASRPLLVAGKTAITAVSNQAATSDFG